MVASAIGHGLVSVTPWLLGLLELGIFKKNKKINSKLSKQIKAMPHISIAHQYVTFL
jgi:hypothetical protein